MNLAKYLTLFVCYCVIFLGCKPDELKPQNNQTNPTETTVTLTDSLGKNQVDLNNPIAQVKINIQAGIDVKIVTFKLARKIGNDPSEILVNNNNIDTVKDFKLVSSFYDNFNGKNLISGDVVTYSITILDSKNKTTFSSLSYLFINTQKVIQWSTDIQPLINGRCAIAGCHVTGGVSPNLSTYSGVFASKDWIKVRAIDQRTMPAPGTGPLNETQFSNLKRWLSAGALQN